METRSTADPQGDQPHRYNPPALGGWARALGFSSVVTAPPGHSLVFVSGQLATNDEAGFAQQVAEAFESLRVALDAVGASPQTVLRITCLVVDHDSDRLGIVSDARRQFFGGHGPASTLIPVPRLAGDRSLFEVDAIALTDRTEHE